MNTVQEIVLYNIGLGVAKGEVISLETQMQYNTGQPLYHNVVTYSCGLKFNKKIPLSPQKV